MVHRKIKNPNITILFKKGDCSQCRNYREIFLLSVVGKSFADILLQRLKWAIMKAEKQSAEPRQNMYIYPLCYIRTRLPKVKTALTKTPFF